MLEMRVFCRPLLLYLACLIMINNTNNDNTGTWTLGFNKFLNKGGYTRWQVNYERRREEETQAKNDQFLAQFQAGF